MTGASMLFRTKVCRRVASATIHHWHFSLCPYQFFIVQNIVVNPELANAMHAQSGAERQRRARIIESEGERTSIQNFSEGKTRRLRHRFLSNIYGQGSGRQTSTRARALASRPSTSLRACTLLPLKHAHGFIHSQSSAYAPHAGSNDRLSKLKLLP